MDKFLEIETSNSKSILERVKDFFKQLGHGIAVAIEDGTKAGETAVVKIQKSVIDNAIRAGAKDTYFIQSRNQLIISDNNMILNERIISNNNKILNEMITITPNIYEEFLKHEETLLSANKIEEWLVFMSLIVNTNSLGETDRQFLAGKKQGVYTEDGTYFPQWNALTTKNEGGDFHYMSVKNFSNSLMNNELFRIIMRASSKIVTTDGNGNNYSLIKVNPDYFSLNTDGIITFKKNPISDKKYQMSIGPSHQNTNQLTIGSSLSDSEQKDIEMNLSNQLQLQSQAEETKPVTIMNNKYTYIGNYPNGEGVLTNNENGEIYTLRLEEGHLTTIQNPDSFGNVKDFSKYSIESINNEYYLMYDGKPLVVVHTKNFNQKVLKEIDERFVETYQREYLGIKPKTKEELAEQFYQNLERSSLDMAGEIFGNAMAVVGIAALSVAAAGVIAPTSFGVAAAPTFYATRSAVTAANIMFDVSTQQFLMYSMNLPFLYIGIGASVTSGYVSVARGTFGSTFDYIFLQYKKNNICIQNKELYCAKVKNGDQDVVINQFIIRLKENVLKLILVFNDLLSDSYKLYNDNRSMFSLARKYTDPSEISVKNFIANYCSSECSKIMNTLQELLSSNPNLKILNKFIQFYQYNDVNFNKGVFDWIFLLNDVINVFSKIMTIKLNILIQRLSRCLKMV